MKHKKFIKPNTFCEYIVYLSHELRNPMNDVLSSTELMLQQELDPKISEGLAEINTAAGVLFENTNDLVDIAKMVTGQFKLVPVPYSPRTAAEDVGEQMRARFGDRLNLTIEVDEELPQSIIGDVSRVRQIMRKLVINAANVSHGRNVRLYLYGMISSQNSVGLRIEVTDSSKGALCGSMVAVLEGKEEIPEISQSGSEGDILRFLKVKTLCEYMGGRLRYADRFGEGSVFTAEINQDIDISEKGNANQNSNELSVLSEIGKLERMGLNATAAIKRFGSRNAYRDALVEFCTRNRSKCELIRHYLSKHDRKSLDLTIYAISMKAEEVGDSWLKEKALQIIGDLRAESLDNIEKDVDILIKYMTKLSKMVENLINRNDNSIVRGNLGVEGVKVMLDRIDKGISENDKDSIMQTIYELSQRRFENERITEAVHTMEAEFMEKSSMEDLLKRLCELRKEL